MSVGNKPLWWYPLCQISVVMAVARTNAVCWREWWRLRLRMWSRLATVATACYCGHGLRLWRTMASSSWWQWRWRRRHCVVAQFDIAGNGDRWHNHCASQKQQLSRRQSRDARARFPWSRQVQINRRGWRVAEDALRQVWTITSIEIGLSKPIQLQFSWFLVWIPWFYCLESAQTGHEPQKVLYVFFLADYLPGPVWGRNMVDKRFNLSFCGCYWGSKYTSHVTRTKS